MTLEPVGAAEAASVSGPNFLEVSIPDGKIRRFAKGTKARFALERINSRIEESSAKVDAIESVKEGEESVEFGPDSELVSYGEDWKLKAFRLSDRNEDIRFSDEKESNKSLPSTLRRRKRSSEEKNLEADRVFNPADFYPGGVLPNGAPPQNTVVYASNVVAVFGILFALAAGWVYFLESKFFVFK